jgi:hypothetical protein
LIEIRKEEKWQFRVNESILGPVLIWARKNSRGKQLGATALPTYVREFLNLPAQGRAVLGDFKTLGELQKVAHHVTWQRSPKGSAQGVAEIPAPPASAKPRKIPASVPAIRSLENLCDYFSAVVPYMLNKRMYKGTGCGASISLHLEPSAYEALGPIVVWESWKCCDGREYQGRPWMRTNKDRLKVERQELAGIAKHKCPKCGKVHTVRRFEKPLEVPARGGWIHNGDGLWEKLSRETPIVGFTIQTIVEGSYATVDSEEFVLPVTEKEVETWIKEMESEASFLFQEANAEREEEGDEA